MKIEESVKILAILAAAYPNYYKSMTAEEANGASAIWATQFADVPADIVLMAVNKAISCCKFPPAISEVKKKVQSIHWEACEMITDNTKSPFLSDDEKRRYKRIYNATYSYRNMVSHEPTISQMIEGEQFLMLESRKE